VTPFVILSLPRSRSRWLASFLSYGDWQCGHDEICHCRSLDDVKSWLAQPCTGTVETAGAVFWRLLLQYRPDVRVVTIRRPVDEVLHSLRATGVVFDDTLAPLMHRLDRKLDQVEKRVPGVRSFAFADLKSEACCAELFEHCLPYPHDNDWWQRLDRLNLQINLGHMMRYFHAHRPQLEKVAKQAKQRMLSGLQKTPEIEGVTFQEETMASYDEAIPLFREHAVITDRSPDAYLFINVPLLRQLERIGALQIITARSNGRLFGYLVSVVGPSLEAEDKTIAVHSVFFASPSIQNLGMKLQRAAVETLRDKGVSEVQMRAGVLGAGPRLGAFYRRMGAEDFGQLYRLSLEQ
jgi:GNAT superfamily N-acetyltransferase